MMSIEDDVLLSGIRAGQPDWGAIYQTYRVPMFLTATKILGPDEGFQAQDAPDPPEPSTSYTVKGMSAQDVVSSVFHRLQEHGIPRDVANLRSYLLKAIANEARDALRRGRLRRRDQLGTYREDCEESLEGKGQGSLAESLVDGNISVESLVQNAMLLEGVTANLHLLTDGERFVLVERVFKGRPAQDVALDLGVTPQRISQLARAAARRICLKLGMLEEGKDG